jgi:hypothetical protein
VTTKLAHLVLTALRRTAVVLLAGSLGLAAAGPAGADTPEGWPVSDPVDPVQAVLLLGGIPLLLIVVIALLVVVPGRSRRAAAGHSAEDQWFGGPRQGVAELPAAEPADSSTGGTSARW